MSSQYPAYRDMGTDNCVLEEGPMDVAFKLTCSTRCFRCGPNIRWVELWLRVDHLEVRDFDDSERCPCYD